MAADRDDHAEVRDRIDVLRLPFENGLVGGDRLVVAAFVEAGPRGLQHALQHLWRDGPGRPLGARGRRGAGAAWWRTIQAGQRPRAGGRHRGGRLRSRIPRQARADGDAEGQQRDGAGTERGGMTPAASPWRCRHRRRSSFPLGPHAQAVERSEDLGGFRFVARLKLSVIVVADVAGVVLEVELPERGQDLTLALRQLLARIGGGGEGCSLVAASYQWPDPEQ